jgi:hypothetical protein
LPTEPKGRSPQPSETTYAKYKGGQDRDRMTTDLYFTLDLLDRIPAYSVSEKNHTLIDRILESSWTFHGRVESREQVQIELSFPAHRMWVELLERRWSAGFESRRRRSAVDTTLAFTWELGPKPLRSSGETATTARTANSAA